MSEMTFTGVTKVFTEDERVDIKMYMDNDGKYVVEIFVKDDCRNLSLKNNDDFDIKKNKNDIKRGEDIQTGIKFLKNKSVEEFNEILKSSLDVVDIKMTNQNSIYKLELGMLNDDDIIEYRDYSIRTYYTNAKSLTRGYEGEIKILKSHLECGAIIFVINAEGDKVINVSIPKIDLKTILYEVFGYNFKNKYDDDDVRIKLTYDKKNGSVKMIMGDISYDITQYILDEINIKHIFPSIATQIFLQEYGISAERSMVVAEELYYDIDLSTVDSKYIKNCRLYYHILDGCKLEDISYNEYFSLGVNDITLIVDKADDFIIITYKDWQLIKDKDELKEFINTRKNKKFEDAINEFNEKMNARKDIEKQIETEVFECLEKWNIEELNKNKISAFLYLPPKVDRRGKLSGIKEGSYRLTLGSNDGKSKFTSYIIDSEKDKSIKVYYGKTNPKILLIDACTGKFGVYRDYRYEVEDPDCTYNRSVVKNICINKFLNENGESSLVEKDINSIEE